MNSTPMSPTIGNLTTTSPRMASPGMASATMIKQMTDRTLQARVGLPGEAETDGKAATDTQELPFGGVSKLLDTDPEEHGW